MKNKLLFLGLCGLLPFFVSAIPEQPEACLYFSVNQHYIITGCLAQHMSFAIPEQEFMGKNILEVIHLNGTDKENIAYAFAQSIEKKETICASYGFDNKRFVANITPLLNQNTIESFVIKVIEEKD